MPNWCFTTYKLSLKKDKISQEEGHKLLQSIHDDLAEYMSTWAQNIQEIINEYQNESPTFTIKDVKDLWNGNPRWLGNILLHQSYSLSQVLDQHNRACRGEISNIYLEPDMNTLFIHTDTTCEPAAFFLVRYYEACKDEISFEYISEEETNSYCSASSEQMLIEAFGENYQNRDMEFDIVSFEDWCRC